MAIRLKRPRGDRWLGPGGRIRTEAHPRMLPQAPTGRLDPWRRDGWILTTRPPGEGLHDGRAVHQTQTRVGWVGGGGVEGRDR